MNHPALLVMRLNKTTQYHYTPTAMLKKQNSCAAHLMIPKGEHSKPNIICLKFVVMRSDDMSECFSLAGVRKNGVWPR